MRVNREARAALAEQRRARTLDRLLVAAEAVIAEKGVSGGSIEEFARAAGVSRGTFYNYFPTTNELIDALNQRVARHMAGLLARVALRPVDAPTRLAAALHTMLAAYRADPIRGGVALRLVSSRAPRQPTYVAAFERLYRDGVENGHFHDIDPAIAMTVCFGTLRMTQRDVVSGDAPAKAEELIALVLSAFGIAFDEALRISRTEADLARRP
jgi:AcrR family transcriptional regulator